MIYVITCYNQQAVGTILHHFIRRHRRSAGSLPMEMMDISSTASFGPWTSMASQSHKAWNPMEIYDNKVFFSFNFFKCLVGLDWSRTFAGDIQNVCWWYKNCRAQHHISLNFADSGLVRPEWYPPHPLTNTNIIFQYISCISHKNTLWNNFLPKNLAFSGQ